MPLFQFPIAVVLALSTVGSSIVFFFSRTTEGKVQLPIDSEDDGLHVYDPFDVIKPEDITDGFPIDEDKFWIRVRRMRCSCTYIGSTNNDNVDAVEESSGYFTSGVRANSNHHLSWMVACDS